MAYYNFGKSRKFRKENPLDTVQMQEVRHTARERNPSRRKKKGSTLTPEQITRLKRTPAPPQDRAYGSFRNKPGSAATANNKIDLGSTLNNLMLKKVKEFNAKKSKTGLKAKTGMLKAVCRRAMGAYSRSHFPGVSRAAWCVGRVKAFLYLLGTGKPKNPNYYQDNDLLPKEHPLFGGKRKRNPSDDLRRTSVSEHGNRFETCHPVDFNFTHRKQKSPFFGSMYGQDIEPSGRYVRHGHLGEAGKRIEPGNHKVEVIHGTLRFECPLVIEYIETTGAPGSWKRRLSEHYEGKTGESLSRAIAKDGYDGIVTVGEFGTAEIVDITRFAKGRKKNPSKPNKKRSIVFVSAGMLITQSDAKGVTKAGTAFLKKLHADYEPYLVSSMPYGEFDHFWRTNKLYRYFRDFYTLDAESDYGWLKDRKWFFLSDAGRRSMFVSEWMKMLNGYQRGGKFEKIEGRLELPKRLANPITVVTDTATVYGIAPEQLKHLIREGEWEGLWADNDFERANQLIQSRYHGGVDSIGSDGEYTYRRAGNQGEGD